MIVVIVGWVFFRTADLFQAADYLKIMLIGNNKAVKLYDLGYYLKPFTVFVLLIAGFISLGGGKMISEKVACLCKDGNKLFFVCKNLFTIFLFAVTAVFVMSNTYNPFIYFRF